MKLFTNLFVVERTVRRLRNKVISLKNDLLPGSRLPLKSSPDAQLLRMKTGYIYIYFFAWEYNFDLKRLEEIPKWPKAFD